MIKKKVYIICTIFHFLSQAGTVPIYRNSDCRKQGETHVYMMISLKYVLAPCHFCSKFLETSSKNLCAWTTVVIIHIDRTINHRFICTSGSYMSPHTQYT